MDVEKIQKAFIYASQKHKGQKRKLGDLPYIVHPLEAGIIASTIKNDDVDLICAAVLHDTVEDTDATIEEIRELFGDKVANYVEGDTENKRKELPASATWQIRKEESLKHLKNSKDLNVKIIWLSDKLSNMRSMYENYMEFGDRIWDVFHQKDKEKHKWYYYRAIEYLDALRDTGAYKEFTLLVKEIFGEE